MESSSALRSSVTPPQSGQYASIVSHRLRVRVLRSMSPIALSRTRNKTIPRGRQIKELGQSSWTLVDRVHSAENVLQFQAAQQATTAELRRFRTNVPIWSGNQAIVTKQLNELVPGE